MPETTQEEYCENCGRVMVLKRGRFGQFMACTGYPDCKTTRRLDQGKRVPDVPLEETCPQCQRNLVLRHGRYGEFISCSGYPGGAMPAMRQPVSPRKESEVRLGAGLSQQ